MTRLRLVPPPEPLDQPEPPRHPWPDPEPMLSWPVTLLIATALVIGILAGCSSARASEPLPDLTRTYAELDRMPEAIWVHELTLRTCAPWTRGQR